jgi:hypothetical protein
MFKNSSVINFYKKKITTSKFSQKLDQVHDRIIKPISIRSFTQNFKRFSAQIAMKIDHLN